MSEERPPVDELEPNGYRLHDVSGYVWEGRPEWTLLGFHLPTVAQTEAADSSARRVRG